MKKLTLLNGKQIFGNEIDDLSIKLKFATYAKAALITTAISFTATPLFFPHQSSLNKLLQMFISTMASASAAMIYKEVEDDQKMYDSLLKLNREAHKNETSNRFAKQIALDDAYRDVRISDELRVLPEYQTLTLAQKLNLPMGLFTDLMRGDDYISSPPASTYPNIEAVNNKMAVAKASQEIIDTCISPTVRSQIDQLSNSKLIRTDSLWLQELILSSSDQDMKKRANHHYMIVAETQAGKSTLAGVIASGIAQRSASPAVVACHDAKKIPGKKDITRWLCDFTYKIDGYENADKWVKLATKLCSDQFDHMSETGGGASGVPELILVQDEINTCYGKDGRGYGKQITGDTAKDMQANWLFNITNMAGCKGHIILMGQSPLSTETGISRVAMKGLCIIAMGSTSSYILDNPKNFLNHIDDEALTVMRRACLLFEEEGLRYALIKPTRGNPYVAIIPQFDVEAMMAASSPPPPPQKEDNQNPPQEEEEDNQVVSQEDRDEKIQEIYSRIKLWVNKCMEDYGKYPSHQHIKVAWEKETGTSLSDPGLEFLLKKLGLIEE